MVDAACAAGVELLPNALAAVDGTARQLRLGRQLVASSATWTTSSRVGARTRACGPGCVVVAPGVEERQQEGGGLAGAGLGLADDVRPARASGIKAA